MNERKTHTRESTVTLPPLTSHGAHVARPELACGALRESCLEACPAAVLAEERNSGGMSKDVVAAAVSISLTHSPATHASSSVHSFPSSQSVPSGTSRKRPSPVFSSQPLQNSMRTVEQSETFEKIIVKIAKNC